MFISLYTSLTVLVLSTAIFLVVAATAIGLMIYSWVKKQIEGEGDEDNKK